MAKRSETLWFEDRLVLGLEGLDRLPGTSFGTSLTAHQLVSTRTSSTEADSPASSKECSPPQFWIGQTEGFTAKRAPLVLDGLCSTLLDATTPPPDMSAVLERIEQLLSGTTLAEDRAPMIAIYILWHRLLVPEQHRPDPEDIIREYQSDLDDPSTHGLAARMLIGVPIEWATEQLVDLVADRLYALTRGREPPLPCSWALSDAWGSGSPAVPVWLMAPCHFDGLGGVAAGAVGCVDL